MRKKTLFLILMLISAAIMVMPASAAEVTITFDERNLKVGDTLANQYVDEGVTFTGARVVDTDPSGGKDLGFSPTNGVVAINFNPVVKSVSIDFKYAVIGVMDAVLVNGETLHDYQPNAIITEKSLQIDAPANDPIKKVEVHSLFNINAIAFDDLTYDQIPEFPTVALPVAAVLGILFIIQRKKN